MIQFVLANKNNIATLQDLAKKSWEVAYQSILSAEQMEYMLGTFYSEELLCQQMEQPISYHYYLVQENENFVGFLGFQHHFEPQTTKLHKLYLLPNTQGKGIGKLAIDFLVLKTQQNDNIRIVLNVNKYNSAQKFYQKLGFSTYSEGIFDIGNGFVMDDFLMEKIIK